MASRLEIIEEQQIEYEIPFVTRRGETIRTTTIQINEKRGGVNVSYALTSPSGWELDRIFPTNGVDSLARMIRHIFNDLKVDPPNIILQLWEYSNVNGLYSLEGRAPVSKERDTVLIILTKTPFIYKFGYELVLWHQAMHAKDRLEYRFPSTHPLVEVGEWLDILWHFSVDGRLQQKGKPHYSKAERLDEAERLLGGICMVNNLSDQVKSICDELWGREVSIAEIVEVGKGLGLDTPLWGMLENCRR